ncbi:MAG: hypothetical protein AAB728_01175, partial [Patescibacteria group bacterium]
VGGGWTLQDAVSASGTLTVTNGTVDTNAAGNYPVTVTGTFDQSSTTSQFNANSSTITLSGNGEFKADGTLAQTQYNNATLALNGTNTLTYTNLISYSSNGFANITGGQNGNTTTLLNNLAANSLTVGSGTLGGGAAVVAVLGATPLSLNAAARVSVSNIRFVGTSQAIPALASGYDCSLTVYGTSTTVTQTGNVTINSTKNLNIVPTSTSHTGTWNTAGYNLTVGGNLTIGLGNDTGLKKLNATGSDGRTSTILVRGNWKNFGTGTAPSQFVAADSTVILGNASTAKFVNIGNTGSGAFYNLTQSGAATLTVSGSNLKVTNDLTFPSGAGTFDNATYDKDVTVLGDVTMDNTQVDMGDGTWTVGGNFDYKDVTTWNTNSSTLSLSGSGKSIVSPGTANPLNTLTVQTGAVIALSADNNLTVTGRVDAYGTLTIPSGKTLF